MPAGATPAHAGSDTGAVDLEGARSKVMKEIAKIDCIRGRKVKECKKDALATPAATPTVRPDIQFRRASPALGTGCRARILSDLHPSPQSAQNSSPWWSPAIFFHQCCCVRRLKSAELGVCSYTHRTRMHGNISRSLIGRP